jgi:hypothetical protein
MRVARRIPGGDETVDDDLEEINLKPDRTGSDGRIASGMKDWRRRRMFLHKSKLQRRWYALRKRTPKVGSLVAKK